MNDQMRGTTAIANGTVGVPGSEPGGTSPADPVAVGSNLPPNEPNGDLVTTSPTGAILLAPDSTGPPNTDDYWHSLITEKAAAAFLGVTVRFMQARRQHGGGPRFIRISSRCIRYRRSDLQNFANEHLRASTSDEGQAV